MSSERKGFWKERKNHLYENGLIRENKSKKTLRVLAVLAFPAAGVFFLPLYACLYLESMDPVNKPPKAVIEPLVDEESVYIGAEVILSGENSWDPEGDELTYEWSIEYEVGEENPFEECDPAKGSGSCNGGAKPTCCFIPNDKAGFTVSLRVFDERGFRSKLETRLLVVTNREPKAVITPETTPNERNHYTVGQDVFFHGLKSYDLDSDDRLTYDWHVERPPASNTSDFIFEPLDANRNPTEDQSRQVRCRVVPDVDGTYRIYLTVSDGELTNTAVFPIEVDPDGPPCIRETYPADAVLLPFLVLDGSKTHRLEVLRVEDDLDFYPPAGGIVFSWKISENAGQTFRPVGGYNEPYLDLDPEDFVPGQEIWVRVKVSDRKERELECALWELRCSILAGCPQWVTWIIEFR